MAHRQGPLREELVPPLAVIDTADKSSARCGTREQLEEEVELDEGSEHGLDTGDVLFTVATPVAI